jgi:long-chain acyl-CoA synthetase
VSTFVWPTVADVLTRSTVSWAEKEAVVDGARRLTFGQLGEEARKVGAALRSLGLEDGDRVAFIGDNSLEYMECYLGIPSHSLVMVPVNARLAAGEIAHILHDSECRAVIASSDLVAPVTQAVQDWPSRPLLIATRADLDEDSPWLSYEKIKGEAAPTGELYADPDSLAYIYYTSGTTGRPKGVMLTHANMVAGSINGCAAVGLRREHTFLHASPMFHYGDAVWIMGTLWRGGRQITTRFKAESTLDLILTERVTHSFLVPTAIDDLVSAAEQRGERLDFMTTLLYGGAPMMERTYGRARDIVNVPLTQLYGITETGGPCSILYPEDHIDAVSGLDRMRSAGRETPFARVDIVDDSGREVAPGVVGEIRVTSPGVMAGYWKRQEETEAVLLGSSYLTGDLGTKDTEGFIWITDRKKDMIISGGENVYALEVERVLDNHPGILEAAVIGVPDERWGEAVCAVVVPAPGAVLELTEIQDFARAKLAGYKLPRVLRVVEVLPRNTVGKIIKASLRRDSQPTAAHGS